MLHGYSVIFWGLFFSVFHINLGGLEILPSFVGIIVVSSGIKEVKKYHNNIYFYQSLKYAYILSGLLAIEFIIPILGGRLISENGILNIIWMNAVIILEILFTVKLLEGSITVLKEKNLEEEALRYQNKIRDFILIYTLLIIINNINYIFINYTLGISVTLIIIIVKIVIMFSIKNLGRIKWGF